jgi:hypothetical protein
MQPLSSAGDFTSFLQEITATLIASTSPAPFRKFNNCFFIMLVFWLIGFVLNRGICLKSWFFHPLNLLLPKRGYDWRSFMPGINLVSVHRSIFNCIRFVAPLLRKRKGGEELISIPVLWGVGCFCAKAG